MPLLKNDLYLDFNTDSGLNCDEKLFQCNIYTKIIQNSIMDIPNHFKIDIWRSLKVEVFRFKNVYMCHNFLDD